MGVVKYVLALSFLVVISYFFNVAALFYFIILLSIYLSSKHKTDLLYSIVLAFLISISITGLLVGFFAIFSRDHIFIKITLLLLLGSVFLYSKTRGLDSLRLRSIIKPKLSTILATSILFLVLLFLIRMPLADRSPEGIISLLASGEDNISHITLFNYILKYDKLAYGQSSGVWRGVANYPQSTHAFIAFLVNSIEQFVNVSLLNSLRFYYFASSLLTACVCFFIVKALTVNPMSKGTIEKLIYAFMVFVILLTSMVLSMHRLGYLAQLTSCLFILGLFAFLKNKNSLKSNYELLVATILISGTIVSWYLAALPLIPLVIFILIKAHNMRERLVICTILAISSIQPLLHIIVGESHKAITQTSGNPFGFSVVLFFLISAIAIVESYQIRLLKKQPYVYLLLAGSVGSVFLLGVLMRSFDGSVNYFFFKLCGISLIIVLLSIVQMLQYDVRKPIRILSLVTIALIFFSSLKLNYNNNVGQYLHSHAYLTSISNVEAGNITPLLMQSRSYDDAIYVNPCDTTKQYIINRYFGAILLTQSDKRRDFEVFSLKNKISANEIEDYKRASETRVVSVITDTVCNKTH